MAESCRDSAWRATGSEILPAQGGTEFGGFQVLQLRYVRTHYANPTLDRSRRECRSSFRNLERMGIRQPMLGRGVPGRRISAKRRRPGLLVPSEQWAQDYCHLLVSVVTLPILQSKRPTRAWGWICCWLGGGWSTLGLGPAIFATRSHPFLRQGHKSRDSTAMLLPTKNGQHLSSGFSGAPAEWVAADPEVQSTVMGFAFRHLKHPSFCALLGPLGVTIRLLRAPANVYREPAFTFQL